MSLSSCVTGQVCTYLEDIRPLSCVARGYVTTEDWRRQAERLLPGAARSLPGSPKFQVRALLGKVALERIDPMDITACPGGCTAFLELRHARGTLWRGVGKVALLDNCIFRNNDTFVDLAEFVLSRCAAQILERAIAQWDRESHRLGYDQHPSASGIVCAVAVWIPSFSGDPLVARLRLALECIRWERDEQYGLIGRLEFLPPENLYSTINPFHLRVVTCRPAFQEGGMNRPVAARALLVCRMEDQNDRLLACIKQMCHVHNSYRVRVC